MFEDVIEILKNRNEKVSMMESCTGGCLMHTFTNVEGASDVFQYGAVTYSNAYKIKMGVPKETIDTYTVYSIETARAMAKAIAEFSDSTYGIGVTGKLNREDKNNPTDNNTMVYFSIYNRKLDLYVDQSLTIAGDAREDMKKDIVKLIQIIFHKMVKQK